MGNISKPEFEYKQLSNNDYLDLFKPTVIPYEITRILKFVLQIPLRRECDIISLDLSCWHQKNACFSK